MYILPIFTQKTTHEITLDFLITREIIYTEKLLNTNSFKEKGEDEMKTIKNLLVAICLVVITVASTGCTVTIPAQVRVYRQSVLVRRVGPVPGQYVPVRSHRNYTTCPYCRMRYQVGRRHSCEYQKHYSGNLNDGRRDIHIKRNNYRAHDEYRDRQREWLRGERDIHHHYYR